MLRKLKILIQAALILPLTTLTYMALGVSWIVSACLLMPLALLGGIGRAKSIWHFLLNDILDFCPSPPKFFEMVKKFCADVMRELKSK